MNERSETAAGAFGSSGGGIGFSMTTGQLKNQGYATDMDVDEVVIDLAH